MECPSVSDFVAKHLGSKSEHSNRGMCKNMERLKSCAALVGSVVNSKCHLETVDWCMEAQRVHVMTESEI